MAANTSAIFVLSGDVQWIGAITTANNTKDLTSGTSYLLYTAPTDGGLVQGIKFKADPANNTAATVFRIWINNGSTTGTAANSTFFDEVSMPATTASATAALTGLWYAFPGNGLLLPATYRIYLTIGTAPGGSGQFSATAVAGKYA